MKWDLLVRAGNMKYNAKYDRWVTKEGLVYRKFNDKLVLCATEIRKGYERVNCKGHKTVSVHRLVYETFVGEIPADKEIDHVDTNKLNNKLDNLKYVTRVENMNNPLTKKHMRESMIGKNKGKIHCEFGEKFQEHFKVTKADAPDLYARERQWYLRHNKVCRWEMTDG